MIKSLLIILSLCFSLPCLAASTNQQMVVSAHHLASQAGISILNQGGNAFDAAAATALALGVVEPGSSGIGGGGFFLLYIAKQDRYIMIDGRETSPQLALHGQPYKNQSSINGPQSAGTPGLVAAIDHIIQNYGQIERAQSVAPAIALAHHGFNITAHLQKMIQWRKDALNQAAQNIFLNHGQAPKIGFKLKQAALAKTLKRFAQFGADDFYRGETAKLLSADMQRDGGLIRMQDLAQYQAKERAPIQFNYQGKQFISAALPSSGGITLAEIFGILKADQLDQMSLVDRTHLLIEAMKLAYRDRNEHLGDSDFIDLPDLLNEQRLTALRASIDMQHAKPSLEMGHHSEPMGNSVDTTHFSIVDKQGNMVSATLSINYAMGSGYVSPSTGILLNDEMDDFATRPGQPNAYGLVQGKANNIEPGKRMLSSMTPSFIIDQDRTFIVGTPGGSRIISMVLLAATEFIFHKNKAQKWINQARFHHQFLPDEVQHEPGAFSPKLIQELQRRGHRLKQIRHYGNMQAILWDKRTHQLLGLSDTRGEGSALQ